VSTVARCVDGPAARTSATRSAASSNRAAYTKPIAWFALISLRSAGSVVRSAVSASSRAA
jgi:hypothetical protein